MAALMSGIAMASKPIFSFKTNEVFVVRSNIVPASLLSILVLLGVVPSQCGVSSVYAKFCKSNHHLTGTSMHITS
jgi:hypothetical protein